MLNVEDLNNLKLQNFNHYPILEESGSNDDKGVQIFTPRFVINQMIENIGLENITDINNTILEPASGDGAFLIRILELRLKHVLEHYESKYEQLSLISLSTLYSIEMDQALLIKQRNNIFTLINYFAAKNKIKLSPKYLYLAEQIIKENIIWGETNVSGTYYFHGKDEFIIGWYMPTTLKKTIKVPSTKIVDQTNLFGEIEKIEVTTSEMVEKIVDEDNKSYSNRIRFSTWAIDSKLNFIKTQESIQIGNNNE